MRTRRLVAAATCGLWASWSAAVAGQDSEGGLLRVELTLTSRPVSLSYEPDLRASEVAHAALLSGGAAAAAHLGRLRGHRSLAVGAWRPDPDDPPSAGPERDVWLTREGAGWALELRTPPDADSSVAAESVRIPLRHDTSTSPSEAFRAGLVPTGERMGRMVLRWGTHVWRADLEFVELPSAASPAPQSGAGAGLSLTPESNQDARYRAEALGIGGRDETAMVTPDGARLQVLFHRELGTDGPDYRGLASASDGQVVQLTRAAPIRLRTETPLRFGTMDVLIGNLSPGFPGSYSLWLSKDGAEWRLVLNHEADVWGSQHDPAFDAGEIPLVHTEAGDPDRSLGVALLPAGSDGGRLLVHWGVHEWRADFTY